MSGFLMVREQSWWDVGHSNLSDFIQMLQKVGMDVAPSKREREFTTRLGEWIREDYLEGVDFVLDERFPTPGEMEFWALTCCEFANRLFNREIGEDRTWQVLQIGFAMYTAQQLEQCAQRLRSQGMG